MENDGILSFNMNDEQEETRRNNGKQISNNMTIDELKKLAKVEKFKINKLPNSDTRIFTVKLAINKHMEFIPVYIGETVSRENMTVTLYKEGDRFYGLASNMEEDGEL